ncbi:MAG: 16S rRNA (cytosine(1402)-N(4))-methyltransferase RsmH [Bacteroidales bacterium]|nr:16S rRNA (cytosine(1402)-N(4))-methyltransferase RsmH [Bacteroidales bacterium]
MSEYHNPVMLNECLEGLNIDPNGSYVDVTFGGGGHSKAILDRLEQGRLFAFDQDKDANKNAPDDSRFLLINKNFRYLKNFLKFYKGIPADGILADLGVSSHQFNSPERGFSIRFEGDLDLRMNQELEISAADVVNDYAQEDLIRIFKQYGELKNAFKISELIIKARSEARIETTKGLMEVISKLAPRNKENKFYALVFQALRIEVNEELEVLKQMLEQAVQVLKPGGRLVVMSYHSLEDRLVKNFFRSGNFEGVIEKDFYGNVISPLKVISRKAIVPTEEEVAINSRARSAKLRIAEKI